MTMSEAADAVLGQDVVALRSGAFLHAVETLLQSELGLNSLRVAAGEHIAAILLTALVGVPDSTDEHGGVDFHYGPRPSGNWPLGDTPVAFEVKSAPGPWRRFERHAGPESQHVFTFALVQDRLIMATEMITRKEP
jgi:hypothetical protein